MLEEIKAFLGSDWTETMDRIHSSLDSSIDLLNLTNRAILSHGGKQIRPVMSLLVARACSGGKASGDSISFAAASELLHNATLLHDDVVDSSSERRGAPTVLSILGGPASVLIGDYWLVKAVDNILSSPTHSYEAVRIFSKTLSDLAEGEMLQMQKASTGDTTEEDYFRIIYSKTASLFEAAGVTAAISVDAPQEFVEAVREYSVDLGLAFQIKDDLMDYSSDAAIGKPVGVDLEEQKITMPLLGAFDAAGPEEAGRIRKMVTMIHEHPEYVAEIRDFVAAEGGIGYALSRLDEYVGKAISALGVLPDSKEKDYLARIAVFTAERKR